jgi:hypothetical protein
VYLLLAGFVCVSWIFHFYRRSCCDIYIDFFVKLDLHLADLVSSIVLVCNHAEFEDVSSTCNGSFMSSAATAPYNLSINTTILACQLCII